MTEPPRLSAKDMAEYAMKPSFLKATRVELLIFLERVNGVQYATEVRNLMVQMHRKGKK